MPTFSFVIPCYCSTDNLKHVVEEIKKVMGKYPSFTYEIILVNDCSPDKDETRNLIKYLSEKDPHIVGVNFSKNFGQHSALMAGFREANGDYIVSCDDDGQTPIESLWHLYDKLLEGYEFVCAKYSVRPQKNIIRKMGSSMNEYMQRHLLGKPDNIFMSVYFIATRALINEIIRYHGPYPYLSGLILRSTSKIANIDIEQKDRLSGKSGYNIRKLMKLWINGFTSFSIKPLRIASLVGILYAFLGFLFGTYTIVYKIFNPSVQKGYSTIVSLIMFTCGILMLMMGIVGEYLGRIYICINKSPQYVIKEKFNSKDEIKYE